MTEPMSDQVDYRRLPDTGEGLTEFMDSLRFEPWDPAAPDLIIDMPTVTDEGDVGVQHLLVLPMPLDARVTALAAARGVTVEEFLTGLAEVELARENVLARLVARHEPHAAA